MALSFGLVACAPILWQRRIIRIHNMPLKVAATTEPKLILRHLKVTIFSGVPVRYLCQLTMS
nr:MAG TPA: hypothetical protein [Caudoviricetes sp.]